MDVDIDTKYTCYLLTNTINNKTYVGQTKLSVEGRWKRHIGTATWNTQTDRNVHLLHKAIRKYGPEAFTQDLLFETHQLKEINTFEQNMILFFGSHYSFNKGYNMTWGGEGVRGYILTGEVRNKMSRAQLGKKRGPRSKADKEKIAKTKKGIYTLTASHSKRQSERMLGQPVPISTKKKISQTMKLVWANWKAHAN